MITKQKTQLIAIGKDVLNIQEANLIFKDKFIREANPHKNLFDSWFTHMDYKENSVIAKAIYDRAISKISEIDRFKKINAEILNREEKDYFNCLTEFVVSIVISLSYMHKITDNLYKASQDSEGNEEVIYDTFIEDIDAFNKSVETHSTIDIRFRVLHDKLLSYEVI